MKSSSTATDFWLGSGWRLLDRDPSGRHHVSDDFLRAYLMRPELAPVVESCAAERALHASVLEMPRRPVTPVHLVALADADVRENWGVFLAWRALLTGHATLEDAYLALAAGAGPRLPRLFLDQLAHAILRGVLDGESDGLVLRAAECLFRSQRVQVVDGAVLVADEEHLGAGSAEIDVLGDDGTAYLARSDRHDTALDLGFTRPGLDALCRVLERWLLHMLGVRVMVQPVQAIADERWSWHTGLDAEGSSILDDLWHGSEVDEARRARILSLFRLDIRDASAVAPELRGRPVYLAAASDTAGIWRMKPQNLLLNLPLVEAG